MANVQTYPLHGGQLRHIADRFHIPVSDLLDFSANINPSGPPPSVLSTLRESLDDLTILTEYPDLQQTDLRKALAGYAGTREDNIVIANGFVPLLEAALRTLKVRSCLLPVPSFVEYRRTLERMGVDVTAHTVRSDASFRYDPVMLLSGQEEAILLANPQNPSGACHDFAFLRDLIANAAARRMYVFLDEAFIDYVPEASLKPMMEHFPNLILFRSVTKFFGIPGLRVAYAIANAAHAKELHETLPPWPVTTLASRAVIAALHDTEYCARSRSENLARSVALRTGLQSLGLVVYPSAANFVLFRLPPTICADVFWQHMIVNHRIVLRSCANYEALPEGHFRACVRTPSENERLVAAVKASLADITR